jgi:hypothetical protein
MQGIKAGYRPEIDGLRAFAVLAVVLNHLDKNFSQVATLGWISSLSFLDMLLHLLCSPVKVEALENLLAPFMEGDFAGYCLR